MASEPRLWILGRKLQAVAQTGLAYAVNDYDRERYQAVAETAAELMSVESGTPAETFRHLFAAQDGYATPKVDVRAAVFREGKLLMVREAADNLWTPPGGWADVNDSPAEAVEREALEESGYKVKAVKLACVYDRAKHPHEPPFPFHIYKLFFLCDIVGGEARAAGETLAVDFFPPDALPPLSVSRIVPGQIQRLFDHAANPSLPVDFD
jgi:ADP-ribose pyrophosphatase YjhB (NUDIX family)